MQQITHQIEEIALDFAFRIAGAGKRAPILCHSTLRKLVVAASLGSGIRYEKAEGIANSLPDNPNLTHLKLAAAQHRFPNQAFSRLTRLFDHQNQILSSAVMHLTSPVPVKKQRRELANLVPGIGPKQSSFLFCLAGHGQEIAVLDRHILRFCSLLNLSPAVGIPNSWSRYERIETSFVEYAKSHCVPTDALDAAVWITMRAAKGRVSI